MLQLREKASSSSNYLLTLKSPLNLCFSMSTNILPVGTCLFQYLVPLVIAQWLQTHLLQEISIQTPLVKSGGYQCMDAYKEENSVLPPLLHFRLCVPPLSSCPIA